jgi:DnaJ-class molecular chaperone
MIISEHADLETVCDICDGAGRWDTRQEEGWHRCSICNGAGYVPTEYGKKVLALLRHNFRSMLEDVRDKSKP